MAFHRLPAAVLAGVLAAMVPCDGMAQQDTQKEIERYRQLLAEGNPADLFETRGEELWKTPRGPNKISLEQCDLGKGPGKVEGAFAELPRYFVDADRVMDLETRLLWCRETLQGSSTAPKVFRPKAK